MTTLDTPLRRSVVQRKVYFASKSLYKLTGHLPPPWETPHSVDGKPVYFVHIPKAAGSSLKTLLGCRIGKTTHAMPRLVMRKRQWHDSFLIASVRQPFDRFVSSYGYMVKQQGSGVLNRMYGKNWRGWTRLNIWNLFSNSPKSWGSRRNGHITRRGANPLLI